MFDADSFYVVLDEKSPGQAMFLGLASTRHGIEPVFAQQRGKDVVAYTINPSALNTSVPAHQAAQAAIASRKWEIKFGRDFPDFIAYDTYVTFMRSPSVTLAAMKTNFGNGRFVVSPDFVHIGFNPYHASFGENHPAGTADLISAVFGVPGRKAIATRKLKRDFKSAAKAMTTPKYDFASPRPRFSYRPSYHALSFN